MQLPAWTEFFWSTKIHRDTWWKKGIALFHLAKYKQAIDCLDRVLDADQRHLDSWMKKGIALTAMEFLKEARYCFDQVIFIKPEYKEAWYHKGIELEKLGLFNEAVQCYDESVGIDGIYLEARSRRDNHSRKKCWNDCQKGFFNDAQVQKMDEEL